MKGAVRTYALAVMGWLALPLAAYAETHIYSYDPGSDAARTLAPTGLSFEFEKPTFGSARVTRIIQTGERGSAGLQPAPESALGAGGLKAALGQERPAGRLYEIRPEGDGAAFVNAVCPGAARAWLVIGRLERFQDLSVQAVGRAKGAPAATHCVTLGLSFRSEWRMPQRTPPKVGFKRTGL